MPVIAAALLTLSASVTAPPTEVEPLRENLHFTANNGQWNSKAKFLAQTPGLDVWVTNKGVTYDFYRNEGDPLLSLKDPLKVTQSNRHRVGDVVQVSFDGALASAKATASEEMPEMTHYLRRNLTAHAHNYGAAAIKGLYKGVDMKLYADSATGGPRFDLDVAPGADLSQLRLRYKGARDLSVNANGQVTYLTGHGRVVERGLFAYQTDADGSKHQVAATPVIVNGAISYHVPNRDASKPLTIDPLVTSTFVGGSSDDQFTDIVMNASGEQFVVGATASPEYPVTAGAYDDWSQNGDGLITKMNKAGTAVVWSTYVGGAGIDIVHSIVLDTTGRPVIAGYTVSPDFPTVNAYDPIGKGGPEGLEYDAFLGKLSSDGSALVFSTYFATSGTDICNGLAMDSGGRLYISGTAGANDLPVANAYQGRFGGGASDGFVASFTGDGQTLRFSTYLGGSGDDNFGDVAVDSTGRIAVVGTTNSTNYPTKYALQTANGGGLDGVVTVLDPTGKKMLFSTFYGGSDTEEIVALGFDSTGRIVCSGDSSSADIAVDRTFGTAKSQNGLLMAINSTYHKDFAVKLSGAPCLFGIGIGSDDKITVSGNDNGGDIPASNGAFQYVNASTGDGYLLRLNKAATQISYMTRFGGVDTDYTYDGNYDASGNWHMVGFSSSPDLPTASDAYDRTYGGAFDGYVAQFDLVANKVSLDPVSFSYGDGQAFITVRIPTPVASSTTVTLTGGGGIVNMPSTATIIAGQTSVQVSANLAYTAADSGKVVRISAKRSGQTAQRLVFVPFSP